MFDEFANTPRNVQKQMLILERKTASEFINFMPLFNKEWIVSCHLLFSVLCSIFLIFESDIDDKKKNHNRLNPKNPNLGEKRREYWNPYNLYFCVFFLYICV